MTDNVIVQVPVDVMTWYRADKAMLMERTTLERKLREYMHYLAKQVISRDNEGSDGLCNGDEVASDAMTVESGEGTVDKTDDHAADTDTATSTARPLRTTGVRCYDRYAHRVIDTGEIWAGGMAEVVEVWPLENHWIEVRFDDGRHGVFDVNPYLSWPTFARLKDAECFNQVHIKNGTVCWPGDLDIAAERIWTDCEAVTEHWTYPEDWPQVGDTGPDGSPIVFVSDKGTPVTDKLLDRWAEEADREDFRCEPDSPIFVGIHPTPAELEHMDEQSGRKERDTSEALKALHELSHKDETPLSPLAERNRAAYQAVCRRMIEMREQAGLDLDEMERRTGVSSSELWKAESGYSRNRLFDYLADYCTALGKTFAVTIDDAEERR